MKTDFLSLSDAVADREYTIKSISEEETHTRKLHGYGLAPGAKIKFLFASPFGDPRAYEVLGAVVALRHADSKCIILDVT